MTLPRIILVLLLAGALALVPALPLPGWGAVWADDDGDDDGEDDGDDDGASPAGPGRSGEGRGSEGRGGEGRRGDPLGRFFGRAAPRPPPPAFAAAGEIVTLGLDPQARAAAEARGYRVIEARRLAALGVETLRLAPPRGTAPAAALAEIAALDPAASVDFNHFYRAEQAAEPCNGPHCTARALVNWPAIDAACDPGGIVGLIDTGINAGHEAFERGRIEVIRLDTSGLGTGSGALHGTAVAALLGGAAAGRTPGLLPAARIVAIDAFHRAGGEDRADAFNLATALDLLAVRRAAAINLSLAGPDNAILARVVAQVAARGPVLVAAVGNGGPQGAPAYPAAYPEVIAVTAVDAEGRIWRRAVQGPHVDLAAPGVNVWTAASVSGGRAKTGTSFAAPFVTAAAYVLRMQGLGGPALRLRLAALARDLGPAGFDPVYGHGLLDAGTLCAPDQG
ncbi:MAG: S8 family serine peptidase [Gemmobacter sp.]